MIKGFPHFGIYVADIALSTRFYVEGLGFGCLDLHGNRLIARTSDRTLRLAPAQLERYRRTFDPRADRADYADFCLLGSFERMAISRSLYRLARQEMDQLARDTGGRTFQATDLYAARTAFAEVAAEIGRQYSLGYYSTNKSRDGRYRQIRVDVRGITGAQVSAREGYKTTQGE